MTKCISELLNENPLKSRDEYIALFKDLSVITFEKTFLDFLNVGDVVKTSSPFDIVDTVLIHNFGKNLYAVIFVVETYTDYYVEVSCFYKTPNFLFVINDYLENETNLPQLSSVREISFYHLVSLIDSDVLNRVLCDGGYFIDSICKYSKDNFIHRLNYNSNLLIFN